MFAKIWSKNGENFQIFAKILPKNGEKFEILAKFGQKMTKVRPKSGKN